MWSIHKKKGSRKKIDGWEKFCPQILENDAKIDYHADDKGLLAFSGFGKCHFMTPWNVLQVAKGCEGMHDVPMR